MRITYFMLSAFFMAIGISHVIIFAMVDATAPAPEKLEYLCISTIGLVLGFMFGVAYLTSVGIEAQNDSDKR